MIVEDVMTKPFVIKKDMNLYEAAKILSDKNAGCLIYLKDEEIKGIITERDLLKNFQKNKRVSEIMTKKVITVKSDCELSEAGRIMKNNEIKRLPVVDEGVLVGILTVTDLIANSEDYDSDFFF